MTKLFSLLVALGLAMTALAQKNSVTPVGENYIEISSPKIKKQRIDFNRVYTTDWFVTANDSHCVINFEGPYDSRKLTLAIEWSGKKDEYVITNETSHAGDRSTDFRLSSPDKDTYGDGLGAQPEGDQQVIVKVEKITDDNISGNIIIGYFFNLYYDLLIALRLRTQPIAISIFIRGAETEICASVTGMTCFIGYNILIFFPTPFNSKG